MARFFEKISYQQFEKDFGDNKELYDSIILPKRSTLESAGYDIRSLEDGVIKPGEYKRFKTGLKVSMNSDEVLYIYSRSSHGYKHGVTMVNSVGVIDADFYNNPDNEGHFSVCLINQGDEEFDVKIGDRIAQGVFMKYLIVDDEEEIKEKRIGGFGSTNKKENDKMDKYYISTAIAYTSAKPHIGNTYEVVLADSIARYKRLKGYDVYFQTGTDEHGEKIQLKAEAQGVTPKEYVDNVAGEIKKIWDIMNTSYDKFVRTTDPKHEKVVQKIFKKMYDKGDIYLGEYKGLYCTPCESFWTESQLVDGKCPDCGRDVEPKSEEAYFFKLSKYQDRLVEYIESHPDFIKPESRKNEMINNFIKPGLQDLCVSRTSFNWGIPVDFDPKHVVYVWLDALTNYITNIGYDPDGSSSEFNKLWPADLHLIGKDIIRFHTIYWPCFLMSLDLPMPKQVFGHPWLLVGDGKMSKSKGNVIYADDLVNLFGVDAVRYYVLHEIPYANDGSLTYELLIERINSDLANVLGNLVNRTISMVNKYFDGKVTNKNVYEEYDKELIDMINELDSKVEAKMDNLEIGAALDLIFDVLRRSNKFIDEAMPWSLAKEESKKDRLETVLYNLLEAIRVCGCLLSPFITETSDKIKKQINNLKNDLKYLTDNSYTVGTPEALFMRIDKEKFFSELKK